MQLVFVAHRNPRIPLTSQAAEYKTQLWLEVLILAMLTDIMKSFLKTCAHIAFVLSVVCPKIHVMTIWDQIWAGKTKQNTSIHQKNTPALWQIVSPVVQAY